jgi:hypothetical protein
MNRHGEAGDGSTIDRQIPRQREPEPVRALPVVARPERHRHRERGASRREAPMIERKRRPSAHPCTADVVDVVRTHITKPRQERHN